MNYPAVLTAERFILNYPFELSANADIGFMGTILCGEQLSLNEEGKLFLTDEDLDWDGRSITLTEFFRYGM